METEDKDKPADYERAQALQRKLQDTSACPYMSCSADDPCPACEAVLHAIRVEREDARAARAELSLEKIRHGATEGAKQKALGDHRDAVRRLRGVIEGYKSGVLAHARGEILVEGGPSIDAEEESPEAWRREGWTVAEAVHAALSDAARLRVAAKTALDEMRWASEVLVDGDGRFARAIDALAPLVAGKGSARPTGRIVDTERLRINYDDLLEAVRNLLKGPIESGPRNTLTLSAVYKRVTS